MTAPQLLRKLTVLQFWLLLLAIAVVSLRTVPANLDLPNDKLMHFLTYAGLAISALLAYPKIKLAWMLGLFLFGFSVAIEAGQLLVPGRSFELADMIANGCGLVLGFIIIKAISYGYGYFVKSKNSRNPADC